MEGLHFVGKCCQLSCYRSYDGELGEVCCEALALQSNFPPKKELVLLSTNIGVCESIIVIIIVAKKWEQSLRSHDGRCAWAGRELEGGF